MGQRFTIETPLMWLDKAATWALADALGSAALVGVIVEQTHTCCRGERGRRHDWGFDCGVCAAFARRVPCAPMAGRGGGRMCRDWFKDSVVADAAMNLFSDALPFKASHQGFKCRPKNASMAL